MDNKRTRLRSQAADVPILDSRLSSQEALQRSAIVEVEVGDRGFPVVLAANKRKRDPRGAARRLKQKLESLEGSVSISVCRNAKASRDEGDMKSERYENSSPGEVFSSAPTSSAVNTYVIIPDIIPRQGQAIMKQLDKRRESSRLRIKPSKFREGFLLSTNTKCRVDIKSGADDVTSSLEIVLPVDSHARSTLVEGAKASNSCASDSERILERPCVPGVRTKLKITCKSGTARAIDLRDKTADSISTAAMVPDDNGLKSAYAVLKRVMQIKSAEPFNEPVDPVALELPDYLDVIQRPMDLGTIRELLEAGKKYETAQDVYEDVQLVWRNCRQYNQEGDPIMDILKVVENVFNKHWNAAGLQTFILGTKVPKLCKQGETHEEVANKELVPAQEEQEGETSRRMPKDSKTVPKLKIVHFDSSSLRQETERSGLLFFNVALASVKCVIAESKTGEDKKGMENVKITREDPKCSKNDAGDILVGNEQEPWKSDGTVLNTGQELRTDEARGEQRVVQVINSMKDGEAKQVKRPTGLVDHEAKTLLQDKESTLRSSPSSKRRTFGTVHHKPACSCVVCVGRRRKLARQEIEGLKGIGDRRSKSKSHGSRIQEVQVNKTKVAKSPKPSLRQKDGTSNAAHVESGVALERVQADSFVSNSDVDALVDVVGCYPANYELPLRKLNPSLLFFSEILFAAQPNTVWKRYHSFGSSIPAKTKSPMFEAVHALTLNEKKP